ncbi:MAG: hypothetical protein KAS32_26620 [Candidatus Peribacteraceae bacterium]|nr:hypothetical protein [Candidatus Peribacteraceae bacterium]
MTKYVESEKVEPYQDGQWRKCFRQGGPLEWYNDPWNANESFVFAGTRDEWANKAAESWDNQIGALPSL